MSTARFERPSWLFNQMMDVLRKAPDRRKETCRHRPSLGREQGYADRREVLIPCACSLAGTVDRLERREL